MLALWLALAAPLEVDWNAPASCPDAGEFSRRVDAEADEVVDTDLPEIEPIRVSVTIRELADGRWRLSLEVRQGETSERRELDGDSCEAVVDAAVLVASLRLVQIIRAHQTSPTVPRAPSVPAIEEPPPAESPRTREPSFLPEDRFTLDSNPTPPPREPPRVGAPAVFGWLAAQTGVALGILPGVGAGLGIEGGVGGRGWRVGLAALGFPVRRSDHPRDARVGVRLDLAAAGVLGCGVPAAGRFEFPLCGRFEAGGMRGVGTGAVAEPLPRWSTWLGAGASASAVWRVSRRVAPRVTIEGLASLRRPAFAIGTVPGRAFAAGIAGFRAWVGVELVLCAPQRPGCRG